MAITWWRSLKSMVSAWPWAVFRTGFSSMDQSTAVEMIVKIRQRNTSCLQSLNAKICSSTGNVMGFQTEQGWALHWHLPDTCSVVRINGWWGTMPLRKFQYFFMPVLLCILPGLNLFSLGRAWAGLSHSLQSLSGHFQEIGARLSPGYLMAGQDTRGIPGADGIRAAQGQLPSVWGQSGSGTGLSSCFELEEVPYKPALFCDNLHSFSVGSVSFAKGGWSVIKWLLVELNRWPVWKKINWSCDAGSIVFLESAHWGHSCLCKF